MKKKYIEPIAEIVILEAEDILSEMYDSNLEGGVAGEQGDWGDYDGESSDLGEW